jgi:alpha-mannosidase
VQAGPGWLENEYLRVDVMPDGSLTLMDKSTQERYCDLNVYEDCGDVGDEYIFRPAADDSGVTTAGVPVSHITAETTSTSATLTIGQTLTVPACAEPAAPGRGQRRSSTEITLALETTVRLRPGGHAVEVTCSFDNVARDHRLRALFPTEVKTDVCAVDSAFDVVERRIRPWSGWRNPANSQPQQAFVDLSDGRRGLLIANRGLPEYEVLRDEESTLALTLLRSIGHLGDWGIFPTPAAQCPGRWTAEYAIIPHSGTWEAAASWAREFAAPLHAVPAVAGSATLASQASPLPADASFLHVTGDALVLAACKRAEVRDSVVVRLYNPTATVCQGSLSSIFPLAEAYLTSLEECRLRPLSIFEYAAVEFAVAPKAIVTLELVMVGCMKH